MMRSKPSLAALQHFGGVLIVLAPLATCIAAGAVHATLWLDEISYWYYEGDPNLRALEMRRPGSSIAPLFMNYFYCDIQRVVHWIVSRVGLTIQSDPELFLRLLSIVSFAATALFVYFWTFRESRSWRWSVAAALVISASPLLLFYAFEARVSAFATLGVIVHVALLSAALRHPRRSLWIAGAILGIFLGHLYVWIVALFGALCIAAIPRFFAARNRGELWTVAAFAIPGAITATAEAAYITFTYPPGGYAFALYAPRPFWFLSERMFAGVFSAGRALMPAILRPFDFAPSIPLLLLIAAVVLMLITVRRSPVVILPAAAVLAFFISIVVGTYAGHLIVPRYQVPLFGALFFSLTFAASRNARIVVTLLAAVELMLLPKAVADVFSKGNGKEIAAVIEAEAPHARTAVIIQHALRLGYPDPLHNFVLHFYLDEVRPTAAPIHLYELPSLRDITEVKGVRDYFGGGPALAQSYATAPEADWQYWLATSPFERVWFVRPIPAIKAEADQSAAFHAALLAAGFAEDRGRSYRFSGYPPTHVGLFIRLDRHDAAGVANLSLERALDLGAVDEARHENGVRLSGER